MARESQGAAGGASVRSGKSDYFVAVNCGSPVARMRVRAMEGAERVGFAAKRERFVGYGQAKRGGAAQDCVGWCR